MAPRFELGIEALQASALPLGHATVSERASLYTIADSFVNKKLFESINILEKPFRCVFGRGCNFDGVCDKK